MIDHTEKDIPSTEMASAAPITEQITLTTPVEELPIMIVDYQTQKPHEEVGDIAVDQATTDNVEDETTTAPVDQITSSAGVQEPTTTETGSEAELKKAIEEELQEISASEENLGEAMVVRHEGEDEGSGS